VNTQGLILTNATRINPENGFFKTTMFHVKQLASAWLPKSRTTINYEAKNQQRFVSRETCIRGCGLISSVMRKSFRGGLSAKELGFSGENAFACDGFQRRRNAHCSNGMDIVLLA
jgi:hypothetical protein